MMTTTITIEQLRKVGACEEALNILKGRFGESFEVNEENAVACAVGLDWEWAARNLLSEELSRKYWEQERPIYQEYDKNRSLLWGSIDEVMASQSGDYSNPARPDWLPTGVQYNEKAYLWFREQDKLKVELFTELQKARARLFVSLYNMQHTAPPDEC